MNEPDESNNFPTDQFRCSSDQKPAAYTLTEEEILQDLSFYARDFVKLNQLEEFIDDCRTFELEGEDCTVSIVSKGCYRWLTNNDPRTECVGTLSEMPRRMRIAILEDAYQLRGYHLEKKHPEILAKLEEYYGATAREFPTYKQLTKYKAIKMLESPNNAFLRFRIKLLDDYHYGDLDLKTFMLRCANRPAYDSPSPLIHIDTTGKEGTGKSGLMDKVLTTIPSHFVKQMTSISPTALYYDTLEHQGTEKVSNPMHYHRKIIAIAEANDSAGWMAIKAFAEADQFKEYEHMATQKGEALKMKVRGARSVWITSVYGINDVQVLRRFVHCSVDKETEEVKGKKVDLMNQNFLRSRSISNDSRLPLVLEGMEILWGGAEKLRIVEPEIEVRELIQYLGRRYANAGYSTTSVSQFYTLCETAAFEKRFQIGRNKNIIRIELEDVLESCWLFSSFGDYTSSNLTAVELEILKSAYSYIERNKAETVGTYPTAQEIRDEGDLSQSSVNRALRLKLDVKGSQGKLIEQGYFVYEYEWRPAGGSANYDQKVTIFKLTTAAYAVLKEKPHSITVDNPGYETIYGKKFEPIDPRKPKSAARNRTDSTQDNDGDDADSVGCPNQNPKVLENYGILKKDELGFNSQSEEEKGALVNKFHNSNIIEEWGNTLSLSPISTPNHGILESPFQDCLETTEIETEAHGNLSEIPRKWAPKILCPRKMSDDRWIYYVEMKILKNVPTFIGVDEKNYELKEGGVVFLPESHAEVLWKREAADYVEKWEVDSEYITTDSPHSKEVPRSQDTSSFN